MTQTQNRNDAPLRVATLGGPGTFAGQATSAALKKYTDLGDVVYYPTMTQVWDAVTAQTEDVGLLGAETSSTGLTEIAERLIEDDSCSVLGEVVVPYNCMLLGKPGASIEQITLVVGHGSLKLCERTLNRLLPNADLQVHPENSMAAARDVINSDGSVAVIGTTRSKEDFGLELFAEDVDEGSECAWWLLSARLHLGNHPDRVIVAVEPKNSDTLQQLLTRMSSFNMKVRSIATKALGSKFKYAHLVVFAGPCLHVPVDLLLWNLEGCRLVGAFSSIEERLPTVRSGASS